MINNIIYRNDYNIQKQYNVISMKYDETTDCHFMLLAKDTKGVLGDTLCIVGNEPNNKRGYTVTELMARMQEYFSITGNFCQEDVSKYIEEFYVRYKEVFKASEGKGVFHQYDYLDMLKVIKRQVIQKYKNFGLDAILGIFIIRRRRSIKISNSNNTVPTLFDEIPVLFDGECCYDPTGNMKPINADVFFSDLFWNNSGASVSELSEFPERYTSVLTDGDWFYITDEIFPNTVDKYRDIIRSVADGNEDLEYNTEFVKYICNKYRRYN